MSFCLLSVSVLPFVSLNVASLTDGWRTHLIQSPSDLQKRRSQCLHLFSVEAALDSRSLRVALRGWRPGWRMIASAIGSDV
eukprot:1812236-Prymnesium_polylepis.1